MRDINRVRWVLILVFIFPLTSFSDPPPKDLENTNSLVLEINLISTTVNNRALRDTLSITVYETTTGDEYVMNTITGSVNIPMQSERHYFIYMSKTGSVTQLIEFQTAGYLNTGPSLYFADYDPVSISDYDGFSMDYPMSVIKFADNYGTPEINNVGINVLYD